MMTTELYQEDRPTPAQDLESIQGFSIVRNRFQFPENFACGVGELRLSGTAAKTQGFPSAKGQRRRLMFTKSSTCFFRAISVGRRSIELAP